MIRNEMQVEACMLAMVRKVAWEIDCLYIKICLRINIIKIIKTQRNQ